MNAQSFSRGVELEAAQECFLSQLELVRSLRAGMKLHFHDSDSRALFEAGLLKSPDRTSLPRVSEEAVERLEMRLEQRLTLIRGLLQGTIEIGSVEDEHRLLKRAVLPIYIEPGRDLNPLTP